jgi:hypothetical protein
MWPVPLGPSLSRCPDYDAPSPLHLVEDLAGAPLPGTTVGLPDRLFVIPWISCTACGRTLARGHSLEPWGDLSCTPEQYVVLGP